MLPLKERIVECDWQYIKGEKCYGYRLANPDLRKMTHRLKPIESPTIRRNLKRRNRLKLPVEKWLFRKLWEVRIGEVTEEELLQIAEDDRGKVWTYRHAIEAIQNGEWWMET